MRIALISMIQHIKKELPNTFVIAGNVGTPEAVRELENAGADATKVGIGPGKVCITKVKTGFGTGGWQLAAPTLVVKLRVNRSSLMVGFCTHGDIAKSIRFGASMVMIGSLLQDISKAQGKRLKLMANSSKNTMVQLLNIKKEPIKMWKVSASYFLPKDTCKTPLLRWSRTCKVLFPMQVDARLLTSNTLIMLS